MTAGSRHGFGVTAQIILGKDADHLPLYRLEDVFARAGVAIPRSPQVDLLTAAADVLRPLSDLRKKRLALNQWQPLTAFSGDGRLPIHNNPTENELRKRTLGRKAWLLLGSEAGGEVAARICAVITSATRHQLDPWAYLDDVLRSLVKVRLI